jgi:peptidoglycan/LPS O-acetylase OafA/YrhL
MEKTKEFAFISALRGFAAMLAAYFHIVAFGVYGLQMNEADLSIQSFITIFGGLGYVDLGKCAVALFFVISGFLIPATLRRSDASLRRFLIARVFRLYPAYWFSILVIVIVQILLPVQTEFVFINFLANLTMLQKFVGQPDVSGVFWTLQIELVFYVICGLLFVLRLLKTNSLMFVLTALVLALFCALLRFILDRNLPVALFIGLAFMFWGDLFRIQCEQGSSYQRVIVACGMIVIAIVPISMLAYKDLAVRYILSYWLAIILFVVAYRYKSVFAGPGMLRKSLKLLGDISYSVYLLHAIISVEIARFLSFQGLDPILNVAFALLLTLGISILSYQLVEQPFIRLGKRFAAIYG